MPYADDVDKKKGRRTFESMDQTKAASPPASKQQITGKITLTESIIVGGALQNIKTSPDGKITKINTK